MASKCLLACQIPGYKNYTISASIGNAKYKPQYASPPTSMAFTTVEPPPTVVRRSANYDPTLWSFDHIQSLSSQYTGQDYVARADDLKEKVKMVIRRQEENVRISLELVDDLQRLGIAYHFEKEISEALRKIYKSNYETREKWDGMDLNLKAPGFRLLRQPGYQLPQEMLSNFKEKMQNLKPQVTEDMVSVLNLYEAYYHCFEDERILDEARELTTKYLKENLENMNESIASLVSHGLEFPLHWRVPRVEAKWYIEEYQKRNGTKPILIELRIFKRYNYNIGSIYEQF